MSQEFEDVAFYKVDVDENSVSVQICSMTSISSEKAM